MAGKRYDQYNIAPSEAGAMDYKTYPEATHGQTKDMSAEGDKQRLAQNAKDAKGQPFLPDVPAPSVHAQHGRKLPEDNPEMQGAADTDTDKGNPLA